MNKFAVGLALRKTRRGAGLTQDELAARMGVSQPNIARAESGRVGVGVDFIDRWAKATGEVITLSFGSEPAISFEERGARVRAALGKNRFDPWKRRLTAVERKALTSEGITR